MSRLFTFTDAAQQIGCHKSQVSRHAARLGLGQPLGSVKILTAAEVKKLAKIISSAQPGNPNSNNRNDLGQFKKTRKSSR